MIRVRMNVEKAEAILARKDRFGLQVVELDVRELNDAQLAILAKLTSLPKGERDLKTPEADFYLDRLQREEGFGKTPEANPIEATPATAHAMIDAYIRYQHEQEHRLNREAAEKEAAEAREEAERTEWIRAHGSARLQRLLQEGIKHDTVYLDERLALERPGWQWAQNVPGKPKEARNAPSEALAMLDEARRTDPAAALKYWIVSHEHGKGCKPPCPKIDWAGYVAVSTFLGREIVFGAPKALPPLSRDAP